MANVNKTKDNVSNFFENCRKRGATSCEQKMKECFQHYDHDRDGYLNSEEFTTLIKDVFCNGDKQYEMDEDYSGGLLSLFDTRKDGKLDVYEFNVMWYKWLKQIMDPVTALIIVDVQHDFIDGTLAIKDCPAGQDGAAVVPVINDLLNTVNFDIVIYSKDWHPSNHISFLENVHNRKLHHTSKVSSKSAKLYDKVVFEGPPFTEQVLWSTHCVQNSWGAELHKDLKVVDNSVSVCKGTNPEIDSYSAFWDNNKLSQTQLLSELQKRQVTDVYICGLAYDVCVGATAIHALEEGFRTVVIDDACRGVNVEDIKNTQNSIEAKGGLIVHSSEVSDLVNARDRRPELGCSTMLYTLSEKDAIIS